MNEVVGTKRSSLSKPTETRKKPKLAAAKNRPSPNKKHAKRQISMRGVKLDELKWSGVVPSYRSFEGQGFAGLEEIDGVEIFKDEATGQISLQAGANSIAANDPSGAAFERSIAQKDQQYEAKNVNPSLGLMNDNGKKEPAAQSEDGAGEIEDEWTGLEDESFNNECDETSETAKSPDNLFALLEQDPDQDAVDLSAWNSMHLSDQTMEGLSKLKFSKPTPIQVTAIPSVREGRDVIGKAPTGSGKTLAFAIPILESFYSRKNTVQNEQKRQFNQSPLALVILPTRELASQIVDHIRALSSRTSCEGPKVALLIGNMSIQKQRRIIRDADVVVATPGRLYGVLSESDEVMDKIQKVQFLVIDEADRLLKDGKFEELTQVLHLLEQKDIDPEADEEAEQTNDKDNRQTLVFSATFSTDLQHKLAKNSWRSISSSSSTEASMSNLLNKLKFRDESPLFIDVNPTAQMAPLLHETFLECPDGMDKDLYLYGLLLMSGTTQRTLIFVNSISAVRRLVAFLGNLNMPALSLQSQMPQKARLRSIERLNTANTLPVNSGNSQKQPARPTILIATDVAARGLDLPDVGLIVHYNLPRTSDTYIHRSGRTARASKKGTSVLLCAPQEVAGMRRLVAQIHAKDALAKKRHHQDEEHGAKSKKKQSLQAVTLDAKILSRLKPRAKLAKQIADAEIAREKGNARDTWMQNAANELGAELTSSEEHFSGDDTASGSRGSGKKMKQRSRRERENEARAMTKAQLKVTRAQLRELLSQRVNTGVSERYLAGSGRVDMHKLLEEREKGVNGLWLGGVPGLGLETG